MKHTKKLLALILAAALALLMLTACGGGGGTAPAAQSYGEIVETALNQARRQYGLSEVTLEESLSPYAEQEYHNIGSAFKDIELEGVNYRMKPIDSGVILKKGMTTQRWEEKFVGYIKSAQSSTLGATVHYVADENLKYVGVWMNEKNGQVEYSIVGLFPKNK